MFRKFFLTLAASFLSLAAPLAAQGTDPLLTTVGTTVAVDGHTYAYLLWQPGNAEATFGKRFAIYSKPGDIAAVGNFTRLGIQSIQASPATIRALLVLGEKIDTAGRHAATRIDGLYREMTLNPGEAPAAPADPNLDAAGKLSYLIAAAVEDPRLLGRLFFLGRAHPGVMMCLGHAFAIEVPAGAATYEVREVDGTGDDLQVVGRVVLNPAAPVVLDAPASPVQVPHPVAAGAEYPISPKDNLNARFRWGVGPALRGKMPYSFGFDLFRVKESVAVSLGWHVSPPSPAVMLAAVEAEDATDPDPDFGRVNQLPLLVGDLLDPATAADLSDKERFDIADDGVWYLGADNRAVRRPFADGESFYYYVAARGITGLPGQLSPGTLVKMCDRLPPNPPTIASVLGVFAPPANPAAWPGQGGTQVMQVKIRQVAGEDISESAKGYYVYRWATSSEYLNSVGNPTVGRIGYLAHDPGKTFITFNDTAPGAPKISTHADRAVWYTVRPVGASACAGETLGGHSSPVAGVLRDFKAPDGPTGSFLVCRTLTAVEFIRRVTVKPEDPSIPADFEGISVDVTREQTGVVGAEIQVLLGKSQQTVIPLYSKRHYFQQGNLIRVTLPFREPTGSERLFIRVRSVGVSGTVSSFAQTISPVETTGNYARYEFKAFANRACNPIEAVTDNPPIHDSYNPDGSANPIGGSIEIPAGQGVKEWRIYRRVGDDGELSLIAKLEGTLPPSSVWQDDALPAANGAKVCYFAQVFDQNANPSPLIPLGCVTLANPDLPTPMLSPVKLQEPDGATARAQLEWFCDPVGVDRFEILIAQEGGGVPEVTGLSDVLGASPVAGVASGDGELSFYPFQSPRITSVFGPGPSFGLQIGVPVDKVLHFAIRACGPGPFPRTSGAASNVVRARWQSQADEMQPVIPWPARPLPGTYEMRLPIDSYALGEGPLWTLKMGPDIDAATCFLVGLVKGQIEGAGQGKTAVIQGNVDPEKRLFRLREAVEEMSSGRSLMPFMIYRYQLPSPAFPNARPNLVQCTPLLDRISWKKVTFGKDPGYHISDPFFRVLPFRSDIPLPLSGDWSDTATPVTGNPGAGGPRPRYLGDATGMILVDDPLPVITGAKYRHLFVTFTDRGEIRNVIPLDPVQH